MALLVFGVLILIHETGHYLCARLFHVTVLEFSIGMGPVLARKVSRKTGTAYCLRAFPIGGFVSMEGETEASDDDNAFSHKPVWQRFIITVAGAAMNLLLGLLLMFLLVFSTKSLASTTIARFSENAVSVNYGLAVGDRVTKVNRVSVHTGNELFYELMHVGTRPVDLTVVRDGRTVLLEDVVLANETESGVTFGSPDFVVYAERATFGNLVKHAFYRSLSTVKMIADSLADLVRGRYGMEAVSGPVGTTTVIGQAASQGWGTFLYVVVAITMNLGIMNLLPFPALDGGRILFLLLELLRGKPMKQEVEGYINFVGFALLLVLMVVITGKDIIGLF